MHVYGTTESTNKKQLLLDCELIRNTKECIVLGDNGMMTNRAEAPEKS